MATRTPHPLVSGITRTPHFLVPGITRTPQKNLRLRRIIILQCQDIYAERSQSLNKFATAALIVTTLHRLKRTVCADFWFIRIVALFSSELHSLIIKWCNVPAYSNNSPAALKPRDCCTSAALFVVVLKNVCLCIMNTTCFTRHVQLLISPGHLSNMFRVSPVHLRFHFVVSPVHLRFHFVVSPVHLGEK